MKIVLSEAKEKKKPQVTKQHKYGQTFWITTNTEKWSDVNGEPF